MMRIVYGDTVEQPSAREEPVPHFLEARYPAASDVVDLRVTVVDLEETEPLHARQLLDAHGPAKVGMVHVWHAAHPTDTIDRPLDCSDHIVGDV